MEKRVMPAWVKDAVFYEIYPQSFCDTNGDGIGDLQGIISKLDYIKSLGCNAIWLNPCFESPFADAGYDIADFYKVAPRYGTNDDLKQLFSLAHNKGMKVILDLVAGHTSIEHPFFKASAAKTQSKYDNYFVWTRGWRENTGDYRFISGMAERDGYFMINFFACQPALNYGFCPPDPEMPWQLGMEHPDCIAVQNELQNVMKFYLDMGCDGFRVDMAASLIKGENADLGINILWNRYRSWLEKNYPQAVLVAEWCVPDQAIPAGFHVDFKVFKKPGYALLTRADNRQINNCGLPDDLVSFFDERGTGDAKTFLDELTCELEIIRDSGFAGIISGNHDIGRLRGNGRSDEMMKMIYTFLFTLPGVPFLYYGDEIGIDNTLDLGNKEGSYNRSAARTPMQWNCGKNRGFSNADAEKLYLPVEMNEKNCVDMQEKDENSLLNFIRRIFALRRTMPALSNDASFKVLYCEKGKVPAVFMRKSANQELIVAVNPASHSCEASVGIKNDDFSAVITQGTVSFNREKITLAPCSFAVWLRSYSK